MAKIAAENPALRVNALVQHPDIDPATGAPRGVALPVGAGGNTGPLPLSEGERAEVTLRQTERDRARLTLTAAVAGAILSRASALPDYCSPSALAMWRYRIEAYVDALMEVL